VTSRPAPLAPPEADTAARYLERLERAFHDATGRVGAVERDYGIGGRRLRMRFAGDGLVSFLTPALAHLRASRPEPADLTVYVWDSASTGIPLPACPWTPDGAFGEARTNVDNWRGVEFVAFPYGAEIDVLDRARGLGFHYLGGAHPTAGPQSSLPLLTILDWWLAERDLHCIHSAAVGLESGGVLLAGRGGSGKSTTALACLRSPLGYVADDYCLLSVAGGPRAHALYSSGKVSPSQLERLSYLTPPGAPSQRCEDKEVVFLERAFRRKLLAGFPIRAVLAPRITGRAGTSLAPVSSGEAMKALAPSSLFQLGGARRQRLQAIATLVRTVPCYRLDLGTDLDAIPGVILDLLSRLGA
jgi:hypothetical protein